MQPMSKYVSQLEDCKTLNSHPNSSGPSLGNSANWSCGILVKNLLTLTGLLDSSVVSSLSSTQKVMSSNLGAGTFSNWRQSSKQRYTSQNSDKRAYFLPAFRAQNADIWRKSDRKVSSCRPAWQPDVGVLSLLPSIFKFNIPGISKSEPHPRTFLWLAELDRPDNRRECRFAQSAPLLSRRPSLHRPLLAARSHRPVRLVLRRCLNMGIHMQKAILCSWKDATWRGNSREHDVNLSVTHNSI